MKKGKFYIKTDKGGKIHLEEKEGYIIEYQLAPRKVVQIGIRKEKRFYGMEWIATDLATGIQLFEPETTRRDLLNTIIQRHGILQKVYNSEKYANLVLDFQSLKWDKERIRDLPLHIREG